MRRVIQAEFEQPRDEGSREEPLVIHQRSDPTVNEDLVVFVHGLGGYRYGPHSTWGDFPTLLFQELPAVDVGLFAYRSLVGRVRLARSVPLDREAAVLQTTLRGAAPYQRIVLIAHSMGGLLAKMAVKGLVESGQFEQPPRVTGLILMATPQAGSLQVPWLARYVTKDGRALAPHGQVVTDLAKFFTTRIVLEQALANDNQVALPTWAVLGSSDRWVDALSASLGIPSNRTITVRGSHSQIVKPRSRDSDAFRFVVDCMKQVTRRDATSLDTASSAQLAVRDPLPAVVRFVDRAVLRRELRRFAHDPDERLFLLHAPLGWGKRYLAAMAVKENRDLFEDVVWIDCTELTGSASVFLARLHVTLREHGDNVLEGRWQNADPTSISSSMLPLLEALTRRSYLIVFDRIHRWLNAEGAIGDETLGQLLRELLTSSSSSKLVATSEVLPRLDPGMEVPLGAIVERRVGGLDEAATRDLLHAARVAAVSEQVLSQLIAQYRGMPLVLRLFAERVTRLQADPAEILQSSAWETAVDDVLKQSLGDLPPTVRRVLDQFGVFRRPIRRGDLERLGKDAAPAVDILLQRLLVESDDSNAVSVAEPVRRFVQSAMGIEESRGLHRVAAQYYEALRGSERPESFEEASGALEQAFHLSESGDADSASRVLWHAGAALLRWGYADLVRREATRLYAAVNGGVAEAHCAFLLGEIADLVGRYDEATGLFRTSRAAAEAAGLNSLVALSLYRHGRIASSRGHLAEAEVRFSECIAACETLGVTEGWAGSLLSLAWVHREQGAADHTVKREFEAALDRAVDTHDAQIEAAAHRELGYVAWKPFRDEASARRHFAAAQAISEAHREMKELGAVHATLGYLEVEWGNAPTATEHSWSAIHIAKDIGDRHMLATAYDHLGLAWEAREELDGAAQWYVRSANEERHIGNPSGQVVTSVHLARIYRKQGRHSDAATELEAARRLADLHHLTDAQRRIDEEVLALGGSV